MSSITLSAATRQNLLSLQDTAQLMATTQNRLATGKTVNSALDNPTNFFTSQALDGRSSSLNSLLDGVSNGIQSIQAANQGITSIQKLVDQAKSIANQALSTQLSTTGTAANTYSASTASQTVLLTINGTSVSATVAASSSISATVAALNSAVSSASTASSGSFGAGAIFSVDSTGTKIVLNAQADVEFQNSGSQTALGFTASATTASTYGTAASTVVSSDLSISGVTQRASLANQYNNLLNQITQLAGDASYNGVNLIAGKGNDLNIKFNDTGSSTLNVASVDATASGLGLSSITSSNNSSSQNGLGNFLLNSDVNKTLATLTSAGNTLTSAASSLGSNLSVVQNRQDFSKQLINVLQTGSANLTNADLNQEAANSQALSTRQSMGISALSLANSAQQGVLQLLR
ncbi:flagellar protein [Methylobacterium organophilum]|uniref:flagellin N-terminal helical domain-containing protein n=1 Tax=Methylobacterium TaxID=407 RepID=UPI0005E79122|nr:flagellin [Methylobacterium organophilum]MBN6822537.1 flagellar protein [Methylobacterium organophilum]GAN51035.1 putative flagellar protein [Methylobacterium sp. ME121]